MTRDQHHVGLGLADSRRHRADAHLGDELHMHARRGIRVLEIVDQLLQILDRIDVVVRRRADQSDSRRAVTGLGDPRVHLVSGQLSALTRLGALSHLDLQVVRVHEVLARHAETPGRHLLDGRTTRWVVQALGILATLAGVALSTDRVHGDGECFVRLGRDRSVTHRAGRESLHDVGDALDLFDRHRRATRAIEVEESAQRRQVFGLVVDERGVLLEDVVSLGARRVLQLEHRLGVEEVILALATPLVLATEFEFAMRAALGIARIRHRVPSRHLGRDLVETDSAESTDRAREVLVDQIGGEADRFEDLRPGVRRHRAHSHLRHHLEHTLARGLDVLLHRRLGIARTQFVEVLTDHVLDRLERQVRVDRSGAETDEESHVVHLAGITGLDQ